MVEKDREPELIVIAVANGSGKTSVTQKFLRHEWADGTVYINLDKVAKEKFGDWNSKEAVLNVCTYMITLSITKTRSYYSDWATVSWVRSMFTMYPHGHIACCRIVTWYKPLAFFFHLPAQDFLVLSIKVWGFLDSADSFAGSDVKWCSIINEGNTLSYYNDF